MWKFLLGIAVGIVVAFVGALIVVFAMGRLFSTKQVSVEGNSVLVLALSGELPEAAPVDIPIPFVQAQSVPTVRDIWTSLRQAATDNRIKAVVLQPTGLVTGWGKLQEPRQEIVAFKKSGKPVYAFLQSPGSREYYLGSVADKIFLSPDDMLGVKGFLLEEMYFKNRSTSWESNSRWIISGATRMPAIFHQDRHVSGNPRSAEPGLDQIYNDFCATVGQGRHKSAAEVKALVDTGPFGSQAKAAGLIESWATRSGLHGLEEEARLERNQQIEHPDLFSRRARKGRSHCPSGRRRRHRTRRSGRFVWRPDRHFFRWFCQGHSAGQKR